MATILFDPNATDRVAEVRKSLDSLLSFFTNDPVALLCEVFSHFHIKLNISQAKITDLVHSSLSYLEECNFQLDIETHSSDASNSFINSKVKQDIDSIIRIMSDSFSPQSLDQHHGLLSRLRKPDYTGPWLEAWITKVNSELSNAKKAEGPLSALISWFSWFFSTSPPCLESTMLLRIQSFH
ncbi:hypothetical protein GEMRC1_011532 [Eukaryota sp. GEM-RC1]